MTSATCDSNGVGTLTLKRASKSRPSGQWSDDDYDVFDGDQHIGRIMLSPSWHRSQRSHAADQARG
jgi:hypothetical protein